MSIRVRLLAAAIYLRKRLSEPSTWAGISVVLVTLVSMRVDLTSQVEQAMGQHGIWRLLALLAAVLAAMAAIFRAEGAAGTTQALEAMIKLTDELEVARAAAPPQAKLVVVPPLPPPVLVVAAPPK